MEDCLIPENLGAHQALRQRLPWQTLATGEHWYTPYTFFDAAAQRVADIFQPDIDWVGGFTACQRIAAIADAAGLQVILHAGMNTPYGQHFTWSTTNTSWGEYFVGGGPGRAARADHRLSRHGGAEGWLRGRQRCAGLRAWADARRHREDVELSGKDTGNATPPPWWG